MTRRKRSTFRPRRSTSANVYHRPQRGQLAAFTREAYLDAAARTISSKVGIRRGAA